VVTDRPVAIVTGAGRGIGAAVASELARHEFRLVLTARTAEQLEAVAGALRSITDVATVCADVADPDTPQLVTDAAMQQFHRIDVLVNNAAVGPSLPVLATGDAEIDRIVAVNLLAPIRMSRAAAQVMSAASGGRIINISSIFASVSRAGFSLYTMTKGGLESLTKGLAVEWAPHRIAVNAVAPGHVETDILNDVRADADLYRRMKARVPVGRMGEPSEIADIVGYLAVQAPLYLTGSVIVADGGEVLT
jgi:NAD(P)-dependent dehydrogenase (short-subunit alcohol dehydrogenase family)